MTENNGHGNVRDERGRFAPGCTGGPGNPHGKQAERFRSALMAAVTGEDMAAIARRLVKDARAGNVRAASLLFDRLLGKALDSDLLDKLSRLESMLGLEP